MKKLIYILIILMSVVGCKESKKAPAVCHNKITYVSFDSIFYKKRRLDSLNAYLDSMAAAGHRLIVRGSDREYDTIIDHIAIRYIKEK